MEKININYCITENAIKVESNSTVLAGITRRKAINIKQIDKDIRDIRKICKDRKIVFSQKYGLYKFFKDNKNKYLEDIEQVNTLFNELVKGWQEKVQKGIYVGYSDDEEIKRLEEITTKINTLCLGENIDKFTSLYNEINKIKIDLQNTEYEIKRIVL